MNSIQELLKASIEETVEQVYSNEVRRQCKLAWYKGLSFGLLIGGIVLILTVAIIYSIKWKRKKIRS